MGDVVHLDESKDVGAANRRLLAALYCGTNSGFEVKFPCLQGFSKGGKLRTLGTSRSQFGHNIANHIHHLSIILMHY